MAIHLMRETEKLKKMVLSLAAHVEENAATRCVLSMNAIRRLLTRPLRLITKLIWPKWMLGGMPENPRLAPTGSPRPPLHCGDAEDQPGLGAYW